MNRCEADELPSGMTASSRRMLFWACFMAIAATSAVFAIRGQVIMDWAAEFQLTETQKGEILGIALAASDIAWQWRIAMLFIPMSLYGLLLIGRRFPVHERVAAGISDREMYRETGAIGLWLVLVFLLVELGRIFGLPFWLGPAVSVLLSLGFLAYTRSLGQPVLLLLLVLMIPLATTELGTDSWITSLMEMPMREMAIHAGWVLVYTSFIMMVLRFCATPVVRLLTPLGLMVVSCALACAGLIALSKAAGIGILLAATLYGIGKSYLWPTVMGIVAERFPRGGALSLNAVSAVGMMSVGVAGTVFLGQIQDRAVERELLNVQPALHAQVVATKSSTFGDFQAVDPTKARALPEEDQQAISSLTAKASQQALATSAIFPAVMLAGYLSLLLFFRRKGGYKAVELA